jgi:hypothetical protein
MSAIVRLKIRQLFGVCRMRFSQNTYIVKPFNKSAIKKIRSKMLEKQKLSSEVVLSIITFVEFPENIVPQLAGSAIAMIYVHMVLIPGVSSMYDLLG